MPKINYQQPENNDQIVRIQKNADYQFKNHDLLNEALTHPSYAAEHEPTQKDNQRLEFLGDAVLQIILSDYLFRQLPDEQEGVLTRIRSFLANEQATAQYTKILQLDLALKLGHGEDRNGGRKRPSILGDLFEAFLGAIYLDGGIVPATNLVLKLLPDLNYCKQKLNYDENPKGALQHLCIASYKDNVHYLIVEESGPSHDRSYTAQALVNDKIIGIGTGKSHKDAEKNAASDALEKLAQIQVKQEELPIHMTVSPNECETPKPKIIALDFDGVLCDSAGENALAAWNAAKMIWTDIPQDETLPETIRNSFFQTRPYLETGYQSVIMIRKFLDGTKPEFFATDLGEKVSQAIKDENLTPKQLIKAFGEARDREIRQNPEAWIESHRFYPGTIQALKHALTVHRVYILTTKQERFIKQLLKSQGVNFPEEAIFGLDRKLSKDAVLATLAGAKKTNVHFVEDRLDTLLRIQQNKNLTRIKLHYAPWGYGTPEQLEEARNNGRINVLTPDTFRSLLD